MSPSSDAANPDGSEPEWVSEPRIGSFRITGVVARGEHSVLYRATDTTLDRDVALKVIRDPELADRLVAEAKTTSRLQHPAIASVYSAGFDEGSGVAYVAYEWVEGIPLRARLRGPIDYVEFLRLTQEVCAAVAYAHDQGLVHGDLKADNVVLTVGEEHVKLIDFGLSRRDTETLPDDDPDDDEELWGTPAYMAPELFEGSPRSVGTDLFALGVLLYEMSTGDLPFGGADGDVETVRTAHGSKPRSPSEARSDLPLSAASRIESLLELDGRRRGPTAAELSRWAAQEYAKRTRGRRSVGVRLAIPILAIVVAVAWFQTRDTKSEAGDRTPSGVQLQELPERVRVGVWFDDRGEPSPDVDFGIELLRLFLSGDDPGTAVAADNRSVDEADRTPAERAAWICGQWSRDASGVAASFVLSETPTAVPNEQALFERADDPVVLAELVATRVASLDLRADVVVASTLGADAAAIEAFVRGVGTASQGRIVEARRMFEDVARRVPDCVEARSWARACAFALGDLDGARWPEGEAVPPSLPGRLIAGATSVPRTGRAERWGAEHPLAKRVDLVLALADPSTTDRDLIESLETSGRGANPDFMIRLAELQLVRGRSDEASRAVTRLRSVLGEDAPIAHFLDWCIENVALGRDPATLFRWLVGLEDRDFRYWCTVGIELSKEEFLRAVNMAALAPADLGEKSRVATASARMVFGHRDSALDAIQGIVSPLDPGRGARLEAAVHILEGDVEAARAALARADEREPEHPLTRFLQTVVGETHPAELQYEPASDASEVERFRRPFLVVAGARRSRSRGDADGALRALDSLSFTTPLFEPTAWPEILLLARVEAVHALLDLGDRRRATERWTKIRDLWPRSRAPKSRVSAAIRSVEVRLDEEEAR